MKIGPYNFIWKTYQIYLVFSNLEGSGGGASKKRIGKKEKGEEKVIKEKGEKRVGERRREKMRKKKEEGFTENFDFLLLLLLL